eukprot:TRINITY_DN136261_c0_g1_i1.p1 TRINITY_DN136261_c0_g1~~TRINITY_DN136261_c0_g1_i1.p1  ORF type:complete len:215 (+),score=35.10 TRINITY_DN136261_c0_g1_i1:71-715(+)
MPFNDEYNHTFSEKWTNVSFASWLKYPNDDRPDIIHVDTINKEFNPETGTLKTTRIVFMKERLPKLMARIFGSGYCICVEDTFVDPKNKIMILKSTNVSYGNILRIDETCTYTQNKENPLMTDYKQEVGCKAFPFGLQKTIENFVGNKITNNAQKGLKIMENAIDKVRTEFEEVTQDVIDSFSESIKSTGLELSKKIVIDGTEKQKSLPQRYDI